MGYYFQVSIGNKISIFFLVSVESHMAVSVSFQQEMTWLFQTCFSGKWNDHFSQVSKRNNMTISDKFQQEMTFQSVFAEKYLTILVRFFVLFNLILYVPVNNLSVMLGRVFLG